MTDAVLRPAAELPKNRQHARSFLQLADSIGPVSRRVVAFDFFDFGLPNPLALKKEKGT
jgi:hypothetical protein